MFIHQMRTTHALISLTDLRLAKVETCGIFVDFQQAFDTVDPYHKKMGFI